MVKPLFLPSSVIKARPMTSLSHGRIPTCSATIFLLRAAVWVVSPILFMPWKTANIKDPMINQAHLSKYRSTTGIAIITIPIKIKPNLLIINHIDIVSLTLFCPAQIGLKALKKKWTIEILFSLYYDNLTYQELKDTLSSVSDKILSERLKDLIKLNLIEKKRFSDLQIKYTLTERGITINRVLYELSLLGLAILDKKSFNSEYLRKEIANLFSVKIIGSKAIPSIVL